MPKRPVIEMSQTRRVETIQEDAILDFSEAGEASEHFSSKKRNSVRKRSSRESKSERRVRWHPKTHKRLHLHHKDMLPTERESVWYNKNDDRVILAMAKVTVKMIMKGEPFDDVDYCSRGLEGKTLIESKKRAKNKRRVLAAVLMEQELQRLEGVKNPQQLAKASFKHTQDIMKRALDKAIEDEQVIQEYLDDVRTYGDNFMEAMKTELNESMSQLNASMSNFNVSVSQLTDLPPSSE